MLEPVIRAGLHRWQKAYDLFPAPARDALTSARGWFLSRMRYAPETFAILRDLRSHETWTEERIHAYQLSALQSILDHARETVPFYRSYPRLKIRDTSDLQQLPILQRETFRSNEEQLISSTASNSHLIRAATTGTTGANLRVVYTEKVARANWAFLLRQWAWAGVRVLEPRLTFYGSRIVPASRVKAPFWVHNAPERQILVSIFHLSEKNAPAYLDFLELHSGRVLEGFPSVLAILADSAQARGRQIPMRVVFTTGEPLYPRIRRKIESAFAARIFDSYGMTELCGLIQQCECGHMHLVPDYGFLEILDDNDEPARPGEEGSFVWTGFINPAMPLIRYRIGDRGCWLSETCCSCGRTFPLVLPTITRESDILRCADGRLFSPRALNQILKTSHSLRCCQFVHDRPECVVVRVVPGDGNGLDEAMQIRAALQQLLGPEIQAVASFASEPITRAGGKIPLIVERVLS